MIRLATSNNQKSTRKTSKERILVVSRPEGKEIDEPLGTQCLKRIIEQEFGNKVYVEHSFGNLPDRKYDHVHISCCNDPEKAAEAYRKYAQSAKLITIGGAYATLYPDKVLRSCPKAICVIGEGEISALRMTNAAMNGTDLRSVPNIVFMQNGKLIRTHRETLDLGCIKCTLNHDFLDLIVGGMLVRMETSRGCDHKRCTFCTIPLKYNGAMRRDFPIELVKEEMIQLSKRGVRSVCFTDEEFIGKDLRRAEEVVRTIRELKAGGLIREDMKFMAGVSVKLIKGGSEEHFESAKELLRSMKRAGFDTVFIGIESGSKTQLKRYGKGVTPEDNEDVLNFLEAEGIGADIGFIMFDPLMSFQELEENIDFILRNGLHKKASRVIKKMIVIQGTPYERMVRKKLKIPDHREICKDSTDIYIDPKVRAVMETIPVEELSCDDSYTIQSRMRMGLGSTEDEEKIRGYRKEEMQKLIEAVAVSRKYGNGDSERLSIRGREEVCQ